MNNLYLAFSVVFPLFCMMTLGYFLTAIHLFNDNFLKQLNNLCFKVFLPMVLFVNIYKSDFKALFSMKLIGFALSSVMASFLLLMLVIPLLEKDNGKRGVIIQGIFRSNFILFGIPITASLYGDENTSTTAILVAFVIPLFNALSVVVLEIYSTKKSSVKSILMGVITNPLIIAAACAIFIILTGLRLPVIVETTLFDISKVATPLALITLGGSFQFQSLKNSLGALIMSIIGKLILVPCIFIPFSIYLGFRNMELAALLSMFASPTAVSTYTMAQSARANDELAGQIVVTDSILSIVTIFIWITVLKHLQLL